MNCFEVLGIEETKEVKKIKRAYAARTKAFHPEEHPEEFKVLHDAYEEALAFARREDEQTEQTAPGRIYEDVVETLDDEAAQSAQADDGVNPEWEEAFEQIADTSKRDDLIWAVRRIMEDCRNLYLNEAERAKLYRWKDLLEEPLYAEVLKTKEFVTAWYEFLESHHLFPFRIWMYFSSQDGLRFSGEAYGLQRFPYQWYMGQAQTAERAYANSYREGTQMQEDAAMSNAVRGTEKSSPWVKRLLYAAVLAGTAIGGGILGVIAGMIFG